MIQQVELQEQLRRLIADGENECAEFKAATVDFDTADLGRYFSALSNEANLRGIDSGWLVFGVNNKRQVVGTDYRREKRTA